VKVERLLLRAPNWIGDVVLSLGAVRDLRRNFPGARLEVLARPWVADVYRTVVEVDAVLKSEGFREDVQRTRGAFDAAVLLPNSFRSALEAFLAGIPERWGYATDGRGVLLTRSSSPPAILRGRSQVYYYRAMLAGLGLTVSASPDVSLRCPDPWRERGAALLGEAGPWVGINPGAAYGTAKRWIPERYAAVADLLARSSGVRTVILGGPSEQPLGEEIAALMDAKALVLAGRTTLPELLGVLSELTLLITNDSGPMHLAGALGVPQVAIFGPTDARETAPVGKHALVREPVSCSPCLLRECPIDHRCMTRVSVDRVAAEARLLLEGGSLAS
jgi:heptosyltransferase-2